VYSFKLNKLKGRFAEAEFWDAGFERVRGFTGTPGDAWLEMKELRSYHFGALPLAEGRAGKRP
jgi:hypothetical protein